MNPERTVGGSSGGESGLLLNNCTLFGIGSDMLGSIRVPTSFCGMIGFMPTPERMSPLHTPSNIPHGNMNSQIVSQVFGPMARNADDLARIFRVFFSDCQFKEDLKMPRIYFNEQMYNDTLKSDSLRIGLLRNTEAICGTWPSIKRAFDILEDKLADSGHEVIDIEVPDLEQHSFNVANLLIKTNLEINIRTILSYVPNFVITFITYIFRLFGQNRLADSALYDWGHVRPLLESVKKRFRHVEDLVQLWKSNDLDVLVFPSYPIPAFPIKMFKYLASMPCQTRLPNYWKFPSGTVPITTVKDDEQEFEEKLYNDIYTYAWKESMKNSSGMPISLEICGLPYTDEKVMAVMKVIESLVEYKQPF